MKTGILAIFTCQGLTKEKYEQLRKEVVWETNQPRGGVFHAASFDQSGNAHVADVWESPETMGAFVEERLMPAMKKFNIQPPKVEVYPVHNVNAYKSISEHILK